MGQCGSQEQKAQPRSILKQRSALGESSASGYESTYSAGPPLVVLDFDLTLTCFHCGKNKWTVRDVQSNGVLRVFDDPPGRLRSIQNFLSDLVVQAGARVVILTLNTEDVVNECLRLSNMLQFVDAVFHCSSRQKGHSMQDLIRQYAPKRVVFADDDERNVQDVQKMDSSITLLPVRGGKGLQPRHMEWIYYAAKGQLSTYEQMETKK
ncbi:hypothetical protein DIPPA_26000 [Diplonema papillatum]|nr:hypothetical protein DIPPA_26000 [Diplonema papillatum]